MQASSFRNRRACQIRLKLGLSTQLRTASRPEYFGGRSHLPTRAKKTPREYRAHHVGDQVHQERVRCCCDRGARENQEPNRVPARDATAVRDYVRLMSSLGTPRRVRIQHLVDLHNSARSVITLNSTLKPRIRQSRTKN